MNVLQAVLLGLVQGMTEFLPISSSGHLVLASHLLGIESDNISFEVAVHLGTLLAVLAYFRRDLAMVVHDFFRGGGGRRVGWMLILATVPTAIIGFSFRDAFEALFQAPQYACGGLLVTSAILFAAERVRAGARPLTGVRWIDALVVGTMQGLAIIPGISRSGSTIAAGIFAGLDRDPAARFSFLLAIPAILGAGVLHLGEFGSINGAEALPFILGVLASMFSGYAAIGVLMAVLRRGKLYMFSAYTATIGIIGLLALPA